MSIASSRRKEIKDPAEQASELLVRLGFLLLVVGAPCLAIVSRRAIFLLVPIGAILIILARAFAPEKPRLRQLAEPFIRPAGLAATFLAAWAALSLAWTPWAASGGERWFKTVGTLLLAAAAADLLPARTRASTLYLLPAGVALASLGTIAAALFGWNNLAYPPGPDTSTLLRSGVGIVLLIWPALAALAIRQRWMAAAALAAIAAIAAIAVWTPMALVALAFGALVYAIAVGSPLPAARILAAAFALLFLLAPIFALAAAYFVRSAGAVPSFSASVSVWAALIRDEGVRLLTGHGIDAASRSVAGGFLPATAPRTILFELWYDYGVVGACGAAALLALAFLRSASAPQPVAAFLVSALACGLTIAVSGLASAQLWWATLISLVALSFSAARKGQYRTQRPRITPAVGAAKPTL